MDDNSIVRQIALFVSLVLLQVLILNQIFFLGYATPFFYIYFIIKLPVATNRNLVVLLGFLMGMTIDLFCNTLGVNAAAITFAAFLRLPIQKLFFEREDFEHLKPKLSVLGGSFIKYAVAMILIHHITLILIESFSYSDIVTIGLRILFSSVLTFILLFAVESLSIKKKIRE